MVVKNFIGQKDKQFLAVLTVFWNIIFYVMLNLCYGNSKGEAEEEFLKTIFVESIEMIKKDMQVVVLSKKEIGCVVGGSWARDKAKKVAHATGGLVQEANQAIDKGLRKAGEVARELHQDFQAGRQEVRNEEKEVPKPDSQPAAPATSNNATHEEM